jgi:3-methyladenine DNA glycosylase AlkD
MDTPGIIAHLRSLENRRNIDGQRRFGITPGSEHLGIPVHVLRALASAYRGDHALALELWESGIHEARILAAHVDDPARVTSRQMDAWAGDFDSWDVCDQVCANLFDRTPAPSRRPSPGAGGAPPS